METEADWLIMRRHQTHNNTAELQYNTIPSASAAGSVKSLRWDEDEVNTNLWHRSISFLGEQVHLKLLDILPLPLYKSRSCLHKQLYMQTWLPLTPTQQGEVWGRRHPHGGQGCNPRGLSVAAAMLTVSISHFSLH